MTRILTVLTCALLLAGCSPQFDWRPVAFGRQGAAGVLPDKPQTQTRQIRFESHDLPLTMHSARAGSVLFALGEAPLEAKLANDPAARERLASWAVAAIYHNAGVEPPAMLPDPGTRFTVDGRGPKGPLRFELIENLALQARAGNNDNSVQGARASLDVEPTIRYDAKGEPLIAARIKFRLVPRTGAPFMGGSLKALAELHPGQLLVIGQSTLQSEKPTERDSQIYYIVRASL